MPTVHSAEGIQEFLNRIERLTPQSQAIWGKMTVAQMLCHLQKPLEVPIGRHELPRSFIMKVIGPMIRKKLLADAPIPKDSPTASTFRITDQRDFEQEKQTLISTLKDYYNAANAGKLPPTHPYWGKLSSSDWDKMQWKHLDHHLGQFGV